MKSLQHVVLGAVLSLSFLPSASSAQKPGAVPEARSAGVTAGVNVTAMVEKVDLARREVTLRDGEGRVFTVHVDESVRNLDQLRKGNVVRARYTESLVYEVKKPGQGAPGAGAKVVADSGKPGEKPKGVSSREVTLTVTIAAIDTSNPKAPAVTFTGPAGSQRTIRVKDPRKLEGVKVGDLVEITYSEALAFSVEKASRK